jgi:hypothetical protein
MQASLPKPLNGSLPGSSTDTDRSPLTHCKDPKAGAGRATGILVMAPRIVIPLCDERLAHDLLCLGEWQQVTQGLGSSACGVLSSTTGAGLAPPLPLPQAANNTADAGIVRIRMRCFMPE